jgi:hypothetical protein
MEQAVAEPESPVPQLFSGRECADFVEKNICGDRHF